MLECATSPPPDAAGARARRKQPGRYGILPLHCRMENQAAAESIAAVVRASPDAAKQPDNCGKLLLHWGMVKQAATESIAVHQTQCQKMEGCREQKHFSWATSL